MEVPDRIGRYRIVGLLGTGAQASVFRARDEDLDTDVAVKVLADNLAVREDLVQSFLAEARLLRSIVDPGIVAVHDVGTLESGQPYLVMDLVEGGSLARRVARLEADGRRVSAAGLAALGAELAAALAAVHENGVVHGDVKPENVFVRAARHGSGGIEPGMVLAAGETVVLGDFGLAAASGAPHARGAGTPGYAAPEQTAGRHCDARADLYSATAVLWRVATGTPPRSPAVAPQATRPDPAPASRDTAPRSLRGFFAAGLAPDPRSRPPDAATWARALAAAAGRRGVSRRGAIVAAAAAAAAVAAGAVILWPAPAALPVAPAGVAAASGGVLAADPAAGALFSAGPGRARAVATGLGDAVAVAADGDGTAFVADRAGNRVLAVHPGGSVSPVAGSGAAGDDGDGTPALEARLNRPAGVAVTADGAVLVSDSANHKVRRVRRGGTITTYAGDGTAGSDGDGGPAVEGSLQSPAGLGVAADGAVAIADPGANRVRRVSPAGTMGTVAGTGAPGFAGDGGPATDAQFRAPTAVAFGPDGSLLVADTGNGRVRRIAPDGTVTTVASGLTAPTGIAVTADATVVVADTGAGRLVAISRDGVLEPW